MHSSNNQKNSSQSNQSSSKDTRRPEDRGVIFKPSSNYEPCDGPRSSVQGSNTSSFARRNTSSFVQDK